MILLESREMASAVALLIANNSAVKMLDPIESFHEDRLFKEGQKRAQADDKSDGLTDPSVNMGTES